MMEDIRDYAGRSDRRFRAMKRYHFFEKWNDKFTLPVFGLILIPFPCLYVLFALWAGVVAPDWTPPFQPLVWIVWATAVILYGLFMVLLMIAVEMAHRAFRRLQ